MTRVFFDTEFTGLHQKTTLISIGLIAESGETFYAELTDYDTTQVDDWIKTNVVDKLYLDEQNHGLNSASCYGKHWLFKGSNKNVSILLDSWLTQFEKVQMWSDCLSYDWVLFCQLFGHAFKVPKNVYYIPFDICPLLLEKVGDADISREKYAYGEIISEMKDKKHNALWDAKVIKDCYLKLHKEQSAQVSNTTLV